MLSSQSARLGPKLLYIRPTSYAVSASETIFMGENNLFQLFSPPNSSPFFNSHRVLELLLQAPGADPVGGGGGLGGTCPPRPITKFA